MYNGKNYTKDLSIFKNERKFCILTDKRKIFENELNKLNLNDNKNPDLKQKLYHDKIDNLFNENNNFNKTIEKIPNKVIINFPNRIQDLFD